MKRIDLLIESSDKLKFAEDQDIRALFKQVLNASLSLFQMQSKGLSLSQIRESIKIMDSIYECDANILELEDSEYNFMKNILSTIQWPDNMRLFIAVVDNFLNPVQKDTPSE